MWQTWISSGASEKTPPLPLIVAWVKEAWSGISKEMIVISFLKTGIANAVDGTEDEVLWESGTEEEEEDENLQFYTVLECPVGASQDALKKSYKKLTKVYHPDKIFHESPHMVNHYTHKFQLLQEAYTALRIVS